MAPKPTKLPRGIDKRGDMYRARLSFEGRQMSIGAFYTLTDAKAALSIARGEIARGIFIPPEQRRQEIKDAELLERINAVTVAEWSTDWLQRLEDAGRSLGTVRSYASTLKVHILPVLGDYRLADVTPEHIDALLQGVRTDRGPWANVARTVRAMFTAAIAARVGGLTHSPVQVSVPKVSPAEHIDSEHVATLDEIRAMTAAMPEHVRIAVPLAALCSLRQGELLGLQRRDFEHLDRPGEAVLHVRRQWHSKSNPPAYATPKRGSARSNISIPDSLVPELLEHLQKHAGEGPEGPLLPSPRNPAAPLSQSALDRLWNVAREAAGRPGFKFHSLRHTGLTLYAQQGATQAELMRRGGHRNVDVAAQYQHATVERDRALTAKLNQALDDE